MFAGLIEYIEDGTSEYGIERDREAVAETADPEGEKGEPRTPSRSENSEDSEVVGQQQFRPQQQLAYGKRESVEGGDDVGVLEAGQQELENGAIVEPGSDEPVVLAVSVDHETDASAAYSLHPLSYEPDSSVLRER